MVIALWFCWQVGFAFTAMVAVWRSFNIYVNEQWRTNVFIVEGDRRGLGQNGLSEFLAVFVRTNLMEFLEKLLIIHRSRYFSRKD